MKKIILLLTLVVIHKLSHAQQVPEQKTPAPSLGIFTIGDPVARFVGKINPLKTSVDTGRFGVEFEYNGVDALAGDLAPSSTTLRFCSGEMMGMIMLFKDLPAGKALALKEQLTGKFGLPESHTTVEPISDPNRYKSESWAWKSGDNQLMLITDEWSSFRKTSVLLNNQAMVMKCMTRDLAAAAQGRP